MLLRSRGRAYGKGGHICPNCGRQYKYKCGLYTHMTFECGKERQFKCEMCNQSYSRKGTLKSHRISVHKLID